MVVRTVPLAAVVLPRPQVGQIRSSTLSGSIVPMIPRPHIGYAPLLLGSVQTSPTPRLMPRASISVGDGGFHVESLPGGKVITGLMRVGPTLPHSSLTAAVPRI